MDLKPVIDSEEKGRADLILLLAVFVLVGIGIVMSYSASAVFAFKQFGDSFYFLKRQILWFLVGSIALLLFQEIDYRIYKKYTKIMLLLSFILLILIFIPGISHGVKGSVRWLGFGMFRFQPAEFVKIFIVIYLVKVFSSERTGMANQVIQLLIPMLIIAVIFILIMLQPDFGTAIDLLLVSMFILFVSGFPFIYILMLAIVSIPMFYLLIYQVDYRRARLMAYLNPWTDRFGNGYHIIQSFIGFKKGGLLGTGLGFGTQKIRRLPEPHTDFIFAVIAEESGLLGTSCVCILYIIIFWRGLSISLKAPDEFGKLLGIGLTLLIIVQAFMNIGVATGSLPTTGIPLPLVSYGGSSLLSNMIALGILLNISRYSNNSGLTIRLDNKVLQ
ncbi:MAG: putative lipid II flippase FtsW [Spirochaetota bacterium]|nr:putative lipid II flippase FtsW [Spirochaetota bacterium]